MKELKPVLKQGVIYIADNGRLICYHCAGASAKYSGRDISGQKVIPLTHGQLWTWRNAFGSVACEEGCTELLKEGAAA